ncbi:MAG: ChaN family lipoprotein, partial [Phycisphaerales bacterium]|nr:ChaN family lipoprotein [Phycisphaerales bacterium]
LAGGLDRVRVVELGRSNVDDIDPAEQKRLGLDLVFPEPMLEALLLELEISHCNLVPKRALHPMVTVQRARDGSMARAMLDAGSGGAVLIAGKGHVRNDRAVPFVLTQLAENVEPSEILSVALVGVEPGLTTLSDYLDGQERFPFDYIIFTERAEPIDHCEKLRGHFSENRSAPGSAKQ